MSQKKRPTGHLQVKTDKNGRGRSFWAFWRDRNDKKGGRRLGPAHIRDSGRRTARGAVIWRAGHGPKPSPEHLTPKEAQACLETILEELRGYAAKRARNRHCRGMARNLLKLWPALWSFANHSGVQPTNNHAERSLRGAVIYRKLSLGSQSEQGERRIERLLSASITCRLQHRSLFAYLTDLLAAHARGDPAPSLA